MENLPVWSSQSTCVESARLLACCCCRVMIWAVVTEVLWVPLWCQADVARYTCCRKMMAPSSGKDWQLHKVWFNQTREIESLYNNLQLRDNISQRWWATNLIWIHPFAWNPLWISSGKQHKTKNLYNVTTCWCVCVSLPAWRYLLIFFCFV